MVTVNKEFALKVLKVVDAGLIDGVGHPEPGKMCVEAAVAYASGEDHNDRPSCVHPQLRNIKINLNDASGWEGPDERALGLRRIAIAQLGSVKKFNITTFNKLVCAQYTKFHNEYVKGKLAGLSLKELYASLFIKGSESEALSEFRLMTDNIPGKVEAWGHDLEDYAATLSEYYDYSDQQALELTAEWGVQALKKMKMPGCKFLYLTETKRRKPKAKAKSKVRRAKR